MLAIADALLFAIHAGLVIFVLAGWAIPLLRRSHLIAVVFVFLSWIGLGLWYGIGYCPLTDWHWQVKWELGERNLPASFIEYGLEKITHLDWKSQIVDGMTVAGGLFGLIASIIVNTLDWKRKQKTGPIE